jgi:MoaA/NifB/PqqE/SkfB family radical SAM enzyme
MTGIKGNPDPQFTEFPTLLDIGIMGHCPNKCPFCYQDHIHEEHMKLEDYKNIIDQIKHETNQVALGGRGDPNLHPNFKEIIEYTVNNNVVANYTTSGLNLTESQIEISKMCGAVAVSAYDKSFTFDALNKLIDANIITNIHMIGCRSNYEKIIDLLSGNNPWKNQFDIKRLNAIILLLFKQSGAGIHMDEKLTPDQIKKIGALIFDSDIDEPLIGTDTCFINHFMKQDIIPEDMECMVDFCEASRFSAYISSTMMFLPCSFSKGEGISLKEKTIRKAWNSDLFKKYRTSIIKNKNCPLNL